jgi:hypothetical protein
MVSERDYEAASDGYASQDVHVAPIGSPLTGDRAAAAGREFLVAEFGSIEAVEAEIRRGRRKIGDGRRGASPVVRARISDTDFAAFRHLEEITGRSQADLVREGVHLLLEQYKTAS